MKLVIDTDVVAAALLGERDRAEAAARVLLSKFDLMAPAHWKAELANVIWKAVMRGHLNAEMAMDAIDLASRMPIRSFPLEFLWRGAVARAIANDHPVYDTLFVELAARESTRVVSYDRRLRSKFPSLVAQPESVPT